MSGTLETLSHPCCAFVTTNRDDDWMTLPIVLPFPLMSHLISLPRMGGRVEKPVLA